MTGVNHNSVINWVRAAGERLPDAPIDSEISETAQVDALQTFVGSKKNKVWIWTVVNAWYPGILGWVVGDRSGATFKLLWQVISCWHCFRYITDGYRVYPSFIGDCDHLVSKTAMTRVEGENSRLRHYLARLHRKTFCYSKSVELLKCSLRLLLHYLHYKTIPVLA